MGETQPSSSFASNFRPLRSPLMFVTAAPLPLVRSAPGADERAVSVDELSLRLDFLTLVAVVVMGDPVTDDETVRTPVR